METPDSYAEVQRLRAKLTAKGRDLLDAEDSYGDTWQTWSAIVMHCRNAGFDEADFQQVALASDAIDHTSRNPEKLIANAWHYSEPESGTGRNAGWKAPIGGRASVRQRLAELSRRIEAARWSGRSGSTDYKVALAMVNHGHENGAWTFAVTTRTIAERAGVRHETVSRSWKRLTKLGLIIPYNDDPYPTDGTSWKLNLHWEGIYNNTRTNTISTAGECTVAVSSLFVHPVFLAKALGPTAGRVWGNLPDEDSVTAAEASKAAGISTASARNNLRRLAGAGLVEELEPEINGRGKPAARFRLVPVDSAYLDALAREYGSDDWFDRQRERHDRERAAYTGKFGTAQDAAGNLTEAEMRAILDELDDEQDECARRYMVDMS